MDILIRPLPSGAIEWEEPADGQAPPGGIRWRDDGIPAGGDEELNGEVLIPRELLIGHPALPFLVLRRGGLRWLRRLRSSIGLDSLTWTTDETLGTTSSPSSIPFLMRPVAPPRWASLASAALLIGLSAISVAMGAGAVQQEARIEELGSEAAMLQTRIQEAATSQRGKRQATRQEGFTDHLRGWASWVSATIASETSFDAFVDLEVMLDPAIGLNEQTHPTHIVWTLTARDLEPKELRELSENLRRAGLVIGTIRAVRSVDAAGPGGRQIAISGRFDLTSDGAGRGMGP